MPARLYREIGPPVNDGERQVLRALRDEVSNEWLVLGNFEFPSGARWYECDALAISSSGWAFLIETKQWVGGSIRGNDHEWLLPSLAGSRPRTVSSPVHMTSTKAKKLATYLKSNVPGASQILVQPLVVLATEDEPDLRGKSAALTVMVRDLVRKLNQDPRAPGARKEPEPGLAEAILDFLVQSARPLQDPAELGPYRLLERLEATDNTELWEATLASGSEARYRVKRYFMDPLLTGSDRDRQRLLVRQDLEALTLLGHQDGVVPLVGNVLEVDNSFVVATNWPPGRLLSSLLHDDEIEPDEVEPLIRELFRSLGAVHARGVTHRNLRPSSLHVAAGRVYITDFDYSRIPGRPGITLALEPTMLDPTFSAPEVLADPAQASLMSDVFSAAAIARSIAQSAFGDADPWSVLPADWADTLRRCLTGQRDDRPVSAAAVFKALTRRSTPRIAEDGLALNDVIDERFVVRQLANTSGGTAVVYRVFDRELQAEFAAKFVRPELADHVDVFAEFARLREIPEHPGIVRPGFAMRSATVRRNGEDHPFPSAFLLTDWLDGTSLADLVPHGLPVVRIMQIGVGVADALVTVHRSGVVHRDVKPENVILGGQGRPVLIDFNISATSRDSLTTQVGTPSYRPPELASPGGRWQPAADIYALAVCLCELIAQKRLGTRATIWVGTWTCGLELQALRSALIRALTHGPDARPDAAELKQMLEESLDEFARSRSVVAGGNPPPYAKEGPNHNPYLDSLIGLFSQSSRSNSGTRGLDDFRRWLYVDTRIDRDLRPAVLSGRLRLLVISGNAGDGKTAFIRMIEDELRARGATVAVKVGGNGARLEYEGLSFVTNWDGSQDEGDNSNDDVLANFFSPFAGSSPVPPGDLVAIIAINEGRLLDFLADRRHEFEWLERELVDVLRGSAPTETWLSVVNLNLRSLTAGAGDGQPIVSELLARLSDRRLWEACATCVIRDSCYAPANAAVLRDPILGPRRAERIRQALDLVRLRRRLHITMRDLVSALAFAMAGNRRCGEILDLFETSSIREILGGFTYNALFAARDSDVVDTRGAASDRLLAELGPLDVAIRPMPEEDGRLWLRGPAGFLDLGQELGRPDQALLEQLWTIARESGRESGDWAGLRIAYASLRRRHYLEREDAAYLDMFPYEHLQSFMAALVDPPASAVDRIATAISHSEGLRSSAPTGLLAVRVVQELGARDRSFVTHRSDDFELKVVDRRGAAPFIENLPDLLSFRHRNLPSLALDIDVDLWEALMRMGSGFTPSREDLRGSWLSLQTFKEQVASVPSPALLIQPPTGAITRVQVDEGGRIVAGALA
jgi:serine/threonine protein kinase